jgi:hypothetical protein
LYYEKENLEKATDEPAWAYMGAGVRIFMFSFMAATVLISGVNLIFIDLIEIVHRYPFY